MPVQGPHREYSYRRAGYQWNSAAYRVTTTRTSENERSGAVNGLSRVEAKWQRGSNNSRLGGIAVAVKLVQRMQAAQGRLPAGLRKSGVEIVSSGIGF